MSAAQLHLLLNHLPVLIPMIAAVLISAGLLVRSKDVREAGAYLLAFSALSALAVYFTGEPAENILKNYPGTSRLLIEDHESSALFSLILLELSGIAALIFIWGTRFKKAFTEKYWTWLLLVLLVLTSFGFVARTAHKGGLIRHEEIRESDRY